MTVQLGVSLLRLDFPPHDHAFSGAAVSWRQARVIGHAPRAGHAQYGGLEKVHAHHHWTCLVGCLSVSVSRTSGFFSKIH